MNNFGVCVAWHNPKQIAKWKDAWGLHGTPDWLFLEQDTDKAGCARTKNKAIKRALDAGVHYVICLDDDCFPAPLVEGSAMLENSLINFAEDHVTALQPQPVQMIVPTSRPLPRGFPYRQHTIKMPVAASMGFWLKNPDFDAVRTLAEGETAGQFAFLQQTIYGKMFPLSGMNFAFHRAWADEAVLIDVPRFDDIWMGFIWQKIAYERRACFNLQGPMVTHSRQSNVWKNLQDEVRYLELNESLWSTIYTAPAGLSASELRLRLFGERFDSPAVVPAPPGVV